MRIGAAFATWRRAVEGAVVAAAFLSLLAFAPRADAAGGGGATGTSGIPKIGAGTLVAAIPPMGWDSWDSFGCGVNEQEIEQTANALVKFGLRDAGYRYVIIDDCWFNPTRGLDGSLRGDGQKFPTGMRWLAWYLHSRGLEFGIYESPSQMTCAQENHFYPGSTGSLGHEEQDARTFASWGVDYLKYDYCSPDGTIHDQVVAFTKMRDALRSTHRPIVYSINPNSFHSPTGASHDWSSIANLVRTTPDLAPFWDTGPLSGWFVGLSNDIATNAPLWGHAGPGHWNDPDTLMVGLHTGPFVATTGATGLDALLSPPLGSPADALSREEMRTNFAMWAMMSAPLILADDVRFLSPAAQKILLNRGLIAIDQDPLGRQAIPIWPADEVWIKRLVDGSVAAALFNRSTAARTIATTARQLGLAAAHRYTVLDLWTGGESTTTGSLRASVPAHGVAVFRVAPVIVKPTTHRQQASPKGH